MAGGWTKPELAQVGAERGRCRAGGRILDDAAGRERVARVEAAAASRQTSWRVVQSRAGMSAPSRSKS